MNSRIRILFPVLLTYFLDTLGLAIIYPIFTPLFLLPQFSFFYPTASLAHRTILLGLLIASFPLAQFFGAPLIGELSDRIGRKRVFIATISASCIGYFLTGIGIQFSSLSLLWLGRLCNGFFAGNLTLCLATLADVNKDPRSRAKNFGWLGSIGGISFVLAILLGGNLSNPDLHSSFSPSLPFFVIAALSLCNLFSMYFLFEESHPKKLPSDFHLLKGIKNLIVAIGEKTMRNLFLTYFFYMITWVTSMQFLSTFLLKVYAISLNGLTLTFTLIGTFWLIANFVINPFLSKRVQPRKTLVCCLLLMGAFLLLSVTVHSLPLFLLFFMAAVLCSALSWTNVFTTISLSVAPEVQGSIQGMNQSIGAIACIIGPIMGGLIAGYDTPYLFAFTGTSSLLAALFLIKKALKTH